MRATDAPTAAARVARPGGGLLLDLDGTLVDSEPLHRRAFAVYFASRGWDVPDDVVREFSGRRAHEVFPVLDGPWRGEDPHALTRGVLDALGHGHEPPVPVRGAADLLAACDEVGLPVAVVTSAGRAWTARVVDMLGARLERIELVTAEDCTHGKPDPEPYRRGAERLGLAPGDLVAAEDAPAGIASALGAGIGWVLGMTTSHPAERLVTAGAHETAVDLEGIAEAVRSRRPGG
ncbi:HAD family phosphatase [Cellulomonas fimi]|uniref:HAD family phosphatase n=1 Tax=Cellulomonas fimi TaxID=1708 RepID=A0A7Y0QH91_CELFI|nr:HAD family phosphatase [Cellulomonas fimi]NMR19649.1 HAD family phosphatase [Cellulomonas fimi]